MKYNLQKEDSMIEQPPIFIPLGTTPSAAVVLKHLGWRTESLPFDWIECPLEQITEFVKQDQQNIKGYLQTFFKDVDMRDFRHRFNGTWFPNDFTPAADENGNRQVNQADINDVIDKYVVRFKLFNELLAHAQNLVFVTVLPFYHEENATKFKLLKQELLKKFKGKERSFFTINLYSNDKSVREHVNLNYELDEDWDKFHQSIATDLRQLKF